MELVKIVYGGTWQGRRADCTTSTGGEAVAPGYIEKLAYYILYCSVLFCSSSLWNLKLQSSRNTNVYSRIIEICFSFITGINFIPLFKCDFLCGFVYINPSNSCRTISRVSTVNSAVLHMYFFLLHTGLIINISRIYSFNDCIITQRYVTDF